MTRGLGGIERLPSGKLRAKIWIAGRRQTNTTTSMKLAEAWLRAKRLEKIEVEAGIRPQHKISKATVAQARDALLAYWEAGSRRVYTESTLDGYRKDLGLVLKRWGTWQIRSISEQDIVQWHAEMRTAGLATATIRNRTNLLALLLQQALRSGLIPALPCTIPRPRAVTRSRREALTEAELETSIAQLAEDPRALCVLLLAADAGLRRGEIGRLRLEDVDLVQGWLHVAVRSESDRTKSGRGRDVPIYTERLRVALHAMAQYRLRPLLGFETPHGVDQAVSRVLGRSPLHRARHRWVTFRAAQGDDPWQLMAEAGHADIQTTMRYYHPATLRAMRGRSRETAAFGPPPGVDTFASSPISEDETIN